jgi:predicted phage terminase large subunit-like protein
LILSGRGWGKTRTGAEWTVYQAVTQSKTRWAVVAKTSADIRDTCFEGESGLISVIKRYGLYNEKSYNRTNSSYIFPNGSRIKGFSAEEPDRLRGPQHHGAWLDELAAWQYPDSYDQLMFGLRLGHKPQMVITTTPRPTKIIKNLLANAHTIVTRGNTFDNAANLAETTLIRLQEKYSGTRLGRQELYGEVLDDTEGALWNRKMIEDARVDKLPAMTRIVVAIDPAVTSGEDSDQTGITVAGRTPDGHYYVLESIGLRISPDAWARKAVELYEKYDADRIVAEKNNGGDMITLLLKAVNPVVPVKLVTATRGKQLRAEPISSLYEQGRVHHYQGADLAQLEDQMVSWTPESKDSPDLLDSMVWAITELSVASPAMQYLASRVDFCPSCRMPIPKGTLICPKCQTII